MLIQLQIQNFRSFKDKTTFTTIQGNVKRFDHHVYEHPLGLKILKTSGIYGANGSGKTNLMLSLYYLKKWLKDPEFLDTTEGIKFFTPFLLDKSYKNKSTHFEIDFAVEQSVFTYSVQVDIIKKIILEEKLIKNNGVKELLVFDRSFNNNDQSINLYYPTDPSYNPNNDPYILSKLNNNTLFLSEHYFRNDMCEEAFNWFDKKIEFLFPIYDFNDIAYMFNLRPEYLTLANDIIKISNVGIDKLDISKISLNEYLGLKDKELARRITSILQISDEEFYSFKDSLGNYCSAIQEVDGQINVIKLVCYHKDNSGELVPFDVDQESRGTIVLLHLIPALLRSYGEGINYFLDDINTSLHPILLKEILGQYLSLNLGAAKGQLIFNSHEDFLMDERIIRQDELWLMEKNNNASTIFPLSDFDVRFDLNYKKNYLNGKFGGVPFTEQPQKINFG